MKKTIISIMIASFALTVAIFTGCKKEQPDISKGGQKAEPLFLCYHTYMNGDVLNNFGQLPSHTYATTVSYGCLSGAGHIAGGLLLTDSQTDTTGITPNEVDAGIGMQFDFYQNNELKYSLITNENSKLDSVEYFAIIHGKYDISVSKSGYETETFQQINIPVNSGTSFIVELKKE